MKIKKGDKVMVIAGKSKGATGTVVRAYPREGKVLIDGVNVAKRHRRPTAQNRKGQIVDVPMPIDVSNVQIVDPKTGTPTRVRIQREKDGAAVRIAVKSGQKIT